MSREGRRHLVVLEHFPGTAVLFDRNARVEGCTPSAKEFASDDGAAESSTALDAGFRWLRQEVETFAAGDRHERVFTRQRREESGNKALTIALKRLPDEEGGGVLAIFSTPPIPHPPKQLEERSKIGLSLKKWPLLPSLVEGTPFPVFYQDTEERYLACNAAFSALVGIPKENIIGHTALAGTPANLTGLQRSNPDGTVGEGEIQVFESVVACGDGSQREVIIHRTPYYDAEGNLSGLVGTAFDQSELRRLEMAHQESERRFHRIFQSTSAGMALISPDGGFLRINGAYCRFLDYAEAELLEMTIFDVTPEEEREETRQRWQARIESKQAGQVHLEKRFVRKDGRIVWGRISATWFYDTDDTFLYAASVLQDITPQKELEGELRASSETLHALIASSPLAIFVYNPDTSIRLWNGAAERIFGWQAAEVIGRPNPVVPPDNRQEFADLWNRVARGEALTGVELVRWKKDGAPIPINLSMAAMRNASGRMIGIMSIVEDISSRKNIERALRESEERFRSIFEGAAAGMTTITADGGYLQVNPAFCRFIGYSPQELINSLSVADITHPDDRKETEKLFREVRGGLRQTFNYQKRFIRKDGRTVWAQVTSTWLFDGNGSPSYAVGLVQDITERKQAAQKIEELAYFDPLTGLANRTLLTDRLNQILARSRRDQQPIGLLSLDLDRFKGVNDAQGRIVGDQLLKGIAARLKPLVRASDTLARLGGDEFAVVLSATDPEQAVAAMARKIMAVLAVPFQIDGQEIFTSVSMGIALYPLDGRDADSLLRHADIALSAAKERGKNQYQFFSPEMNHRAVERMSLETSLRRALEREEFFLHFQPQVHLQTGRLIGAEALLRWRHPEKGLIPPAKFIPLAEETGLILPIGEWVLRQACLQAKAWQAAGHPFLRVAVNLSANQFRQANLVAMTEEILRETGLEADCLEFELTESILMKSSKGALGVLKRLKEIGIYLTVDDFGTGYSSLNYLKNFPLNRLKIDKSFVRDITSDPGDAAIAEAIIAMARSLGLSVIAEGVENQNQMAFLQDRSCYEMQGFYFGRPEPAEAFSMRFQQRGRPS